MILYKLGILCLDAIGVGCVMGEWNFDNYIGREVRLYFYDQQKVVPKNGVLIGFNSSFVFLRTKGSEEGIPISRIVRIELTERV